MGIPLETYKIKDSTGKSIAAYRFGDWEEAKRKNQLSKTSGRTQLTEKLKNALLEYYGAKCNLYGEEYPARLLQPDHRIPLKTVISDISVIQNKKLWNEMLDKRIIKKTVPNIIHYYTEYCCDSQLIKFINECDAGMDYSHIENEFGGEIARQFFDSVAVNNEIKTSRYQEILCNMGYGYDVYDTYDISDDKMEVLIKKDVIEMNNVGLEYIRNHYKKYTALYIDENIEAYLRIITSDNFSYEEALHILGMEIGDKEKIDLLGLTTEPISVVGKGYSSSLIKYILDNNFDEHDENELYQHFSEYEEVIQSSIYRVAKSRIANIIDNSTIVLDDNLLSKLLTMSKCSMDDKIQLWAKALPNLTEETCKKHLRICFMRF